MTGIKHILSSFLLQIITDLLMSHNYSINQLDDSISDKNTHTHTNTPSVSDITHARILFAANLTSQLPIFARPTESLSPDYFNDRNKFNC